MVGRLPVLRRFPLVSALLMATVLLLGGTLSPTAQPDGWGSVATVIAGAGPSGTSHPASQHEGQVQRILSWDHGGRTWHLNVSIDEGLLDEYAVQDRLPYSHDYAAYVTDSRDDVWVAALAITLDRMYTDAGLDGRAKLDAILAFAQHFPYALDKDTTPHSEWPRYPAETLVAKAVDCEDTTILFVSILRALGHDVALLNPPRHLAAGVVLPDGSDGFSVEQDGRRYHYAETTGERWRIGKLPDRFKGEEIRVLHLDPQPILSRPTWEVEQDGETLRVTLTARNLGELPARDVTMGVGLQSNGGGRAWQRATCTPTDVAAESTVTCDLVLKTPPSGFEHRLRAWVKSPDSKDRSDSAPLQLP